MTSLYLGFSSMTWMLLWTIGPNEDQPKDIDGPVWHNWAGPACIYLNYVFASYMATLGNFVEVLHGPTCGYVELKQKVFVVVYGLISAFLCFVYLYDLACYEKGKDPPIPAWAPQFADIMWMLCVAGITSFTPREPPLKFTVLEATDEETKAFFAK